jgi:hypothetical protein
MTRARDVADTQENNGGGVPPFVAGKNKIINGDFLVNQRNFTSITTNEYIYDRWISNLSDGTVTFSAQTFTLGAAPVAGYEGKNYLRCVTTGQTLTTARANAIQRIESVRTLAGQTATVSFWAKANSGTPEIGIQLQQVFGTGGSPSASVNTTSKVTISTSWARYSVTLSVPSISGKTLGTNNDDQLTCQFWFSGGSSFSSLSGGIGIQNNTFEIWGVQVEAGNVATPFTTATGTVQGELAACQRYYQKSYPIGIAPGAFFLGGYSVAIIQSAVPDGVYYNYQRLITRMRVAPTVVVYSGSGALNRMSTVSASDLAASSALTNSISDNGFGITNNSGTTLAFSSGGYLFYYTASAEL